MSVFFVYSKFPIRPTSDNVIHNLVSASLVHAHMFLSCAVWAYSSPSNYKCCDSQVASFKRCTDQKMCCKYSVAQDVTCYNVLLVQYHKAQQEQTVVQCHFILLSHYFILVIQNNCLEHQSVVEYKCCVQCIPIQKKVSFSEFDQVICSMEEALLLINYFYYI